MLCLFDDVPIGIEIMVDFDYGGWNDYWVDWRNGGLGLVMIQLYRLFYLSDTLKRTIFPQYLT